MFKLLKISRATALLIFLASCSAPNQFGRVTPLVDTLSLEVYGPSSAYFSFPYRPTQPICDALPYSYEIEGVEVRTAAPLLKGAQKASLAPADSAAILEALNSGKKVTIRMGTLEAVLEPML
ncbi:MAG: hypothetical protein KDK48_02110 [Chlamydiia bacterium]|nr:hypothetical protein [Chlamydiia bacterium]